MVFSEDDTFRILSRPSFDEMVAIREKWLDDLHDRRLRRQLLMDYGWRIEEFDLLFTERIGQQC